MTINEDGLLRGLLVLCITVMVAWTAWAAWFIHRTWTPGVPAAEVTGAAGKAAPLDNTFRATNQGVGALNKILPADPAKVTTSDGVGFYTINFRVINRSAIVRVHVRAYVSAPQPNVAVIAVFLAGRKAPIGLTSKPVSGDKPELVELNVDMPAPKSPFLSFEFRIGPEQPGTIVFNGPQGAPDPGKTTITISEVAQ
jgi:hypothetical protein